MIGVAAQEVVHKRHAAGFIAEARAVHLHSQKRHIAHGARTAVEVVQHLGMTEVLHRAAGPNGHLVSVAGLVRLLAAEVLQVRKIVVHHLIVVLVIAGSQDNALFRVELDVSLGALGDNARDARCVAHQLFRLGGVEEVDALLFRVLGQRLHAFAGVVGLRTEVDGQVVHLVVVDLRNARRPLLRGVGDLCAADACALQPRILDELSRKIPLRSFEGTACTRIF